MKQLSFLGILAFVPMATACSGASSFGDLSTDRDAIQQDVPGTIATDGRGGTGGAGNGAGGRPDGGTASSEGCPKPATCKAIGDCGRGTGHVANGSCGVIYEVCCLPEEACSGLEPGCCTGTYQTRPFCENGQYVCPDGVFCDSADARASSGGDGDGGTSAGEDAGAVRTVNAGQGVDNRVVDADAGTATVRELDAGTATVRELDAGTATVRELDAGTATVRELDAGTATVRELDAGTATVRDIDAGTAVDRDVDGGAAADGSPDLALAREYLCRATGGTVASQACCSSVESFPNMCLADGVMFTGCSCSPSSSRTIDLCNCPTGECFDSAMGCTAR